MSPTTRTAAMRLLTPFIVLALLASALFVAQRVASADEPSPAEDLGYYINYVAPAGRRPDRAARRSRARTALPPPGLAIDQGQRDRSQVRLAATRRPRSSWPSSRPSRSRQRRARARSSRRKGMQEAKLLTILVEFNDDGERRLHGQHGAARPSSRAATASPATSRTARCTTTSRTRRRYTHDDNNTFWVPDFSPEHFNKMLYTKTGITDARPARPDRSGRPARHRHLRLHDEEHVRGDVQGRLHGRWRGHPVGHRPHSEAWYGADRCFQNGAGGWKPGAIQSMNGHPDNPRRRRHAGRARGQRAGRRPSELPLGGLRHRGPGRRRR